MRRLWVHIGHDKTGSSYLQSVFARNLDMLGAAGIAYPVRPDLRETAAKGQTTSGTENGPDLESRMAALPGGLDVLLS
ncbi:hypothetical protein [Shimia sp. SDUM112013]|uniref:hypothetical protein n=1 Tax=Shimia sp. SDUM112013 TaxID=3136160 RepID=UPI0032EDF56E